MVSSFFLSNTAEDIGTQFDSFLDTHFDVLKIRRSSDESRVYKLNQTQMALLENIVTQTSDLNVKKTLSDLLTELKKVPVSVLTATFEPTIQRIASRLGKSIHFEVVGADMVVSPDPTGGVLRQLIHAVRNACDHGIETPDEREAKGKQPNGNITLSVKNPDPKTLQIELRDDGKGIDVERLTQKTLEKGLITQEQVSRMNVKDRFGFIFLDGVSTADQVTSISGRGVGMSALKEHIEQLGGSISIESTTDVGTTLTITIPIKAQEQNTYDFQHAA